MPLIHIIYIPAVLMVGLVLGWILGVKSQKEEQATAERKRQRREERERAKAEKADPAKVANSN
jgi:hypothetical protein